MLDTNLPLTSALENQIWIRGSKIMLGNNGEYLDIDNPEYILESKELDSFLSKYYHNYNIQNKDETSKGFNEYYKDGGQLKTRSKSYNEYMLSEKTPEGETRLDIPLTTKIKTRSQALSEKGVTTYFPYVQRSAILVNELQEQVEKTKTVLNVGNKTIETGVGNLDEFRADLPASSSTGTPTAKAPANSIKIGNITVSEGSLDEFRATSNVTQQASKTTVSSMDLANRLMGNVGSPTVNPVTGKPANIVSSDPAESISPDEAADLMGSFRLTGSGVYRTETNIKAVVEEVSKMLPQFPIEILENVIQTIGGRTAWGQFTGSAI